MGNRGATARVRRVIGTGLLLAAAFVGGVRATTYEPPEFADLAAGADEVLRGRVADVRSFRSAQAGQSLIETAVRIDVAETPEGPVSRTVTLSLLGGRVGDDVLEVDAMPELAIGDEVILFVKANGRAVCPILGWSHGAFRVRRDPAAAAGEYVARWNGAPLTSVAQVADALEPVSGVQPAAVAQALDPRAFLAAVRVERERPGRAR